MAERVGLEPTMPVKAQQFSKLPDYLLSHLSVWLRLGPQAALHWGLLTAKLPLSRPRFDSHPRRGAPYRVRTYDFLLVRQTLSRLS